MNIEQPNNKEQIMHFAISQWDDIQKKIGDHFQLYIWQHFTNVAYVCDTKLLQIFRKVRNRDKKKLIVLPKIQCLHSRRHRVHLVLVCKECRKFRWCVHWVETQQKKTDWYIFFPEMLMPFPFPCTWFGMLAKLSIDQMYGVN